MRPFLVSTLLSILVPAASVMAQAEDEKVNVALRLSKDESVSCSTFDAGSPENLQGPSYPLEAKAARVSGPARIELVVNAEGNPESVLKSVGPDVLTTAAAEAALKSTFKPSKCDGKPVPVKAIIIYNFVLYELSDRYIVPTKASSFRDVSETSPFYEAIVSVTDNYGLGFGYADGNFHPQAPLTKGDFAQFLRLTLDLLQERASVSNKIPREIELFFPLNPLGIKDPLTIVDLEPRKPYSKSISILVNKYDIALVDGERKLKGNLPMKLSEVRNYWKNIFGVDAVPVNFSDEGPADKILSRGEFALFLHESLFVLNYKVLP